MYGRIFNLAIIAGISMAAVAEASMTCEQAKKECRSSCEPKRKGENFVKETQACKEGCDNQFRLCQTWTESAPISKEFCPMYLSTCTAERGGMSVGCLKYLDLCTQNAPMIKE